MIIPKCTGSTPSLIIIGSRIGVQMSSIGARSMKVPSASRRMLMSSSITYLLSVSVRKNAVALAGSCISAMR